MIDRARSRHIDAFEIVNRVRRSRRLAELIEEYVDRWPELSLPMSTIKEFGNYVMHPSPSYDVIRFPHLLRSNALQVVDAIRSVVAALYA